MIRRAAAIVGRRPLASLVTVGGLGIWTMIAVNALLFQEGPHPAPLLGEARPAKAPVAALPRPRPQARETSVAPASVEDEARLRAFESELELVRDLQRALAERDFYDGPVDGLRGPVTENAIRDYERLAGLDETGRPTDALLAHIRLSSLTAPRAPAADTPEQATAVPLPPEQADPNELPSMMNLSEGAPRNDDAGPETTASAALPEPDPQVEAVQRVLADFGYAPGPIDGHMGPSTRAAIRRFEAQRGMTPTGDISARLLEELEAVSGIRFG